jgi:hypothetical protein
MRTLARRGGAFEIEANFQRLWAVKPPTRTTQPRNRDYTA